MVFNPYLPEGEYVPDGEPHVFDGRVYVFGSHDRWGGGDFCLNDYVCWSAPENDLSAWRCEGVIYRRTQDPLCTAPDMRLFAPDVQRGPDGRYYLYYAFDFSGVISVAAAARPAGPYAFYAHVHYADGTPLGKRPGDPFVYDPAVLAAAGGRVFLYTGFCPTGAISPRFAAMHLSIQGCTVTELEPDMCTVRQAPRVLLPWAQTAAGTDFAAHPFFEAPSIRACGGRYYLVYSSIHNHELCWAVSARPDGGFRFGGVLVSNGDIGIGGRTQPLNYTGTNHGGLARIAGRWYVFYHRQTGGTPYARQGCAEELTQRPDGAFVQAEMTSCGLNGGPLPGTGTYPAYIACCLQSAAGAVPYRPKTRVDGSHPYIAQQGADGDPAARQYIANLRSGACAGFRWFAPAVPTAVSACLRADGSGELAVSQTQDGPACVSISVRPGGEHCAAGTGRLPAGRQALWFTYRGTGSVDLFSFSLTPETEEL